MSGSASLAAAKRRRSKVDQSRQSTSTSASSNLANNNSSNSSNQSNNNSMPNRLTTQQSFQYIWQKLMQVESLVNNNYMNIKSNNNSSPNVDALTKKVASVERSIQLLSNNSTQNNKSEVDESKYVSLEQFNSIMSKVAQDMQDVSQKVSDLTDYVSNVQNNNIVLRNMIDAANSSIDDGSVGSGNSETGLDMNALTFNNDIVVDDGSVDSEVNDDVDGDDVDGDDVDGDVVETSTTADISNVLDKLKTLNSDTIKNEVSEELNNNVTLTVSETTTEEKESIV